MLFSGWPRHPCPCSQRPRNSQGLGPERRTTRVGSWPQTAGRRGPAHSKTSKGPGPGQPVNDQTTPEIPSYDRARRLQGKQLGSLDWRIPLLFLSPWSFSILGAPKINSEGKLCRAPAHLKSSKAVAQACSSQTSCRSATASTGSISTHFEGQRYMTCDIRYMTYEL